MKNSKLVFTFFILFFNMHISAQLTIAVSKSDSIKSLSYKVFRVKKKKNKMIKSEPTIAYEYYPIQYPLITLYYNKDGLLIKKHNTNQKDTTYYNSENKKVRTVLIPNPGNSKDSITISYTYDSHGNLTTEKMQASAPKISYRLNNNYYSHESLIGKVYLNYYVSKTDSTDLTKFNNEKLSVNNFYRLFNGTNKLVEEKYLTTSKNPFPYKPDSIIHTIKYQYNKDQKIREISTIKDYISAVGKNYTSTSTEQHIYLKEGLIHEIKHFSNHKLTREEQLVRNSKGILTEYTDHWVNPNRTTKYTYNSNRELIRYVFSRGGKIVRNITLEYTNNSKGHWITCIHYDKKNKPKYLVERNIEYY
jgi:hypothetical protein